MCFCNDLGRYGGPPCNASVMQLLAFSLQRLAGLQAKVAEGEAIKKYHWWGLVLGLGISLVGACVGVGFECVALQLTVRV